MSEGYIFTQNQLKVLLVGYGCNSVSGISLSPDAPDGQAVIDALNQLSNSGMITSNGKSFSGSDAAKRIARYLGVADSYAAVRSKGTGAADLCCYFEDEILVCAFSPTNENSLSLRFSSLEELFSDLLDEGYLPEDSEDIPLSKGELEEFDSALFEGYDPNLPIDEDMPLKFTFELIDSKGALLGFARVVEYYFCDYILFFDGENTERRLYSRERLKSYIKALVDCNDNN